MKTPEHIYSPACARCRDEAEKDRAGVTDTSLCNWHTNDLVLSLRSENARLRAALREIEKRTGHFGEAPPPEWMPVLSLIAWVGRTARAALAGQEVGRAAQERKEDRWLGSDMTEEGDR